MNGGLHWGVAARPISGEHVSGDAWWIGEDTTGASIAIIDGLGHGPDAHLAAERARAAVVSTADLPLASMMQAMHTQTRGTRGVVAGLLRLRYVDHVASYIGVGNTGIYVAAQPPIRPISRNGTVGYRLPSLFEQTVTYHAGDTFILFTDGVPIRTLDLPMVRQRAKPQELAEELLRLYGRVDDDATVLVVQTAE